MGIFALTDIPVGEELSYDYQFQHYGLAQAAGAYRSVLPVCSTGYFASGHVLVFFIPYFITVCHACSLQHSMFLVEPVSSAKCCTYTSHCKSLSKIKPVCLFTRRINALYKFVCTTNMHPVSNIRFVGACVGPPHVVAPWTLSLRGSRTLGSA